MHKFATCRFLLCVVYVYGFRCFLVRFTAYLCKTESVVIFFLLIVALLSSSSSFGILRGLRFMMALFCPR